jgi:hypothetical protein
MIPFALLGIYDPSADGLIKKRLPREERRKRERERRGDRQGNAIAFESGALAAGYSEIAETSSAVPRTAAAVATAAGGGGNDGNETNDGGRYFI